MHTTTHATRKQLEALKAKGAKYIVTQRHENNCIQRGSVLSWHKTYDAAAKASAGQFRQIEEINDAIFSANE